MICAELNPGCCEHVYQQHGNSELIPLPHLAFFAVAGHVGSQLVNLKLWPLPAHPAQMQLMRLVLPAQSTKSHKHQTSDVSLGTRRCLIREVCPGLPFTSLAARDVQGTSR